MNERVQFPDFRIEYERPDGRRDVENVEVTTAHYRGIVEGESTPSEFLPHLIALWERGELPVDRMMTFYDFDQIDQAAHDAEAGHVIKPVLRMG